MRRYRIYEHGVTPHFVTWSITEWLPIFVSDAYCRIVTDSLSYCRREKGLLVLAYVIMPTHLHAVLAVVNGADLSAVIRDARKHTAKEIVKQLHLDGSGLFHWVLRDAARKDGRPDGSYKVWQPGSHPETLESEKFALQKMQYIHYNPVRKGLVELPEHWRYSSAAYYVHEHSGPLEIDPLSL